MNAKRYLYKKFRFTALLLLSLAVVVLVAACIGK